MTTCQLPSSFSQNLNKTNNFFFLDFIELLPQIVQDIEESAFLSFDGEFTGLASERNILPFDTSEEFYLKRLKTSSGFILVQLGLTFFKVKNDPADNGVEKITCKSYNIYVYPQSKQATFLCQGQSLSFLASNGFDFNKLFKNGLSYCNSAEEEKMRKELVEKQTLRLEQLNQRSREGEVDDSKRNFIPVPVNELEMLSKVHEEIQKIVDGKLLETSFDNLNPFQRKLVYELIEKKFNNKVSTSVKTLENNRKALVVETKRSHEEEMKIEQSRQKEEEAYLCSMIGLRLLLKEISASKKLIVGHNCLLDLMFLITQCFEELPSDYNHFKTLTHSIFPCIVDTKFMGNSKEFKEMFPSTVLNQLHQRLTETPFEKLEIDFEDPNHAYSIEHPKEHEAGYDSWLTGYCFLVFLKYLKVRLSGQFESNKTKELTPFLNRIALQRVQNPFIYLTGKEPSFSRAHVFYIKFPLTWQTSDVQDHFKNYGPVNVTWQGNSSAFIALYNKENASCVLKTISRPPAFEIQTFAEFQAADNERKRDLSRKRKKEDSESSESDDLPKTDVTITKSKAQKRKSGKVAKKSFVEGDEW